MTQSIATAAASIPTEPVGSVPRPLELIEAIDAHGNAGYSPFYDERSTSRETAFEKIRARVQGTALASRKLLRR